MARDWWEKGPPVSLSDGQPVLSGSNHTSDYSTGTVTSEIVSANVNTRSVMLTLPDLNASSGLLTGWIGWTPNIPITVQAFTYYAISAAFTVSTSSGAILSAYNNACSLIASMTITQNIAAGAGSTFGAVNSTGAQVGAGVPITFGLVVASCCNAPLGQVQIDYVTTG